MKILENRDVWSLTSRTAECYNVKTENVELSKRLGDLTSGDDRNIFSGVVSRDTTADDAFEAFKVKRNPVLDGIEDWL